MGMYNTLEVSVVCPYCRNIVTDIADTYFGELQLYNYKMGDEVIWNRVVRKKVIPQENIIGEGYMECPECGKDFFLDIHIVNNIIEEAIPNSRKAYIK